MTATLRTPATEAEGQPRLRGSMGFFGLFFSVMAWNAPLVIVVGVIPIMVAVGTGIGTPFVFLCAGFVIAAFAAGFTRMAQILPNPGAFYSYIAAGLGREAGLGAGLTTLFGYFCAYAAGPAFGGVVFGSLVSDTLHGPEAPWWVWGALFLAFAGVLGYLRVDLSAKVLTVCLFGEVLVVLVYDALVLLKGGTLGTTGVSGAPFAPEHFFDGSFAIGLLFALGMFGGFELTALYRDEVKDPRRTVPRATYGVIIFAVVVYSVTAWLFISALGVDDAVGVAALDPTGAINGSFEAYGGAVLLDVANVLVNTSTLAVMLAGHNIVSRYVFNLAADHILPRQLSFVHPRHGSPAAASVATSIAAAAVGAVVVLLGIDPLKYYAGALGITSFVIILVMFLTNVSVFFYMRRHGGELSSTWSTTISPIIAAVGLGAGVVLAAQNFELLIGNSTSMANVLLAVIAGCFAAGVVIAVRFKRTRPETYERIGRQ